LTSSLSADRRPIDPPPIVQLRVIDPVAQQGSSSTTTPSRRRRDSSSASAPGSPTPSSSSTARPHSDEAIEAASYAQSFLQNPYYFMFASLARPDDDNELHWLKVGLNFSVLINHHLNCLDQDGRTRCTTGSVVSSLYHLKDPQHNNEGMFQYVDIALAYIPYTSIPRCWFLCLSGSQRTHRGKLSPKIEPV